MHAFQSFLIVVLCGFVWLTIILGLALAEEVMIYDKDWKVKERIQDGTIYDWDWRVKGHIQDGRVYDRDWNLEKRMTARTTRCHAKAPSSPRLIKLHQKVFRGR